MMTRIFPFLGWFENYRLSSFRLDLVSGLTVALVLVPQSMAYAQLAGLPAYYGLYASFLPPLIASLFGSSRQLATGPVAVVSLMTATTLEPLATAGGEAFIAYAVLLALLIGLFQFSLGVLRLGLVVNFLSHPVVNGFTNAAALIIASSQLSKLFGVHVDSAEHHYETIYNVVRGALSFTHWPTLAIALLAFGIMIGLKRLNPRIPNVLAAVIISTLISWAFGYEHNHRARLSEIDDPNTRATIQQFNRTLADIERKSEERIALTEEAQKAGEFHGEKSVQYMDINHRISLINLEVGELKETAHEIREKMRTILYRGVEDTDDGTLHFYTIGNVPTGREDDGRNWRLKVSNTRIDENAVRLTGGGDVVGTIPKGLPSFNIPTFSLSVALNLLPMAIIISLLGFMEAISIAKAMVAKTGQRLDPNQELIGQGLANIVGSFSHSYAVSGSFSRSAVNIQAGAVSGLSNVFSSCVVVITLLFFTPLLYHLPQAVLAAIIMMAVIGLVNVRGFIHAWKAQKYDGIIGIVTFIFTLAFAPHLDRGIMIGVGLAIILHLFRGMKPNIALLSKHPDGSYRNQARFGLKQCRHIAVIRYNGSLFFANVNYLEEQILERVAAMPELKHIIMVGNGINELDASGEDMLSQLVGRLREAGYDVSISGLNDAVLDVLRRTHLYEKIGEDHLFRNVDRAIAALHKKTHIGSKETACPLIEVVYINPPSKTTS
ncbi:MAG: STAS domain-containing protein [candidate division Zixibacteria bacterium]|nr:STAS domain-containing protein [candidate division Zixibacteria bacterium]